MNISAFFKCQSTVLNILGFALHSQYTYLIPHALHKGVPSSASLHNGVFLVQHDAHCLPVQQINNTSWKLLSCALNKNSFITWDPFAKVKKIGQTGLICSAFSFPNYVITWIAFRIGRTFRILTDHVIRSLFWLLPATTKCSMIKALTVALWIYLFSVWNRWSFWLFFPMLWVKTSFCFKFSFFEQDGYLLEKSFNG